MSYPARALACALLLSLPLAGSTAAQTTWDGGGDGSSWGDPDNWNPDMVPDDLTDVLLDGGVSITIDVTAAVRDLTLDGATLSGPGALTVEGTFAWGAGTVGGAGALTANGGIDFLTGADKIIARAIDAYCDVTWDHSSLFFDTSANASFHHHAGFTFTILESAGASPRSAHQDAPLVGTDPEADNTNVYAFVLDGDTRAETSVTHRMSTRIGGTYTQSSGETFFRGGSGIDPAAVVEAGTGAGLRMGAGTHLVQGLLRDVSGQTSNGVEVLGDQTVFRLDTPAVSLPVRLGGDAETAQDLTFPYLRFDKSATLRGLTTTRTVSVDQWELETASSIDALVLDRILLEPVIGAWRNGNVSLGNGAAIHATNLEIHHTSTALLISDDGVGPPENVTVSGTLSVTQTASVPPRIDTNLGFPNGARFDLEAGTRITLLGATRIAGVVDVGEGARIDLVQGEHEVVAGSFLGGPGSMFVDGGATLKLDNATEVHLPIDVKGKVSLAGANEATAPLSLNGGTVEGPGSLAAPLVVDPPSPATVAKFDGADVALKTGSKLGDGSLQLLNGAQARVPLDATLVIDQSAFGLVIVDDGNGSQIEKLTVEGTIDVARTDNPAHRLQIPVEVTPTGLVVVQPGAKLRTEKGGEIFGTLLVRENGNAAFQFVTAFLRPGGIVRGNGTLTRLINGNLSLEGTVSPGETDGDFGTLHMEGAWAFLGQTIYRIDLGPNGENDRVDITQSLTLGGTLDAFFSEPLSTPPVQDYSVATTSTVPIAGAFDDVFTTGSDGTMVTVVTGPGTVDLHCASSDSACVISGNIWEETSGNGLFDDLDKVPAGTFVRLLDRFDNPFTEIFLPESGLYRFTGVPPELYRVQAVVPAGWTVLSPSSTFSAEIDLEPGQVVFDVNFLVEELATTYPVTNTGDSGAGSLRDAIAQANADSSGLVAIDLSGIAGQTIMPLSELSEIVKTVLLPAGGVSRRRAGGSGPVTIDGSLCPGCDGLTLAAPGSRVSGLTITNFDGYGIVSAGDGGHVLLDNTLTANGAGGLLVLSGNGTVVGGGELGLGNRITGNGGAGIDVLAGTGHRIRGNAISGNAGPAIDLGADGVTGNDVLDIDAGPNGFQNTPLLTAYEFALGVNVTGSLDSRAFTTYGIDVYGSPACPGSGSGDGAQWLGTGTVTTDGTGHADFTLPVAFWAGELTATATDPDGSTSEISGCLATQVVGAPLPAPAGAFVHLAFPNPSADVTTLSFGLAADARVEARIYDVAGRLTRTLHDGPLPAGRHALTWDGRGENGRTVGAGVYFYRLRAGAEEFRGKITRLR